MKANELAIGDWVCATGPVINGEERLTPPMRVVAIGETWVYLEIDPEQGDPFDEKIEDIRPIPLTADILLANGWRSVKDNLFRLDMYDNVFRLCTAVEADVLKSGGGYIDIRSDFGHDMKLPVCSVHQLQQALRLAGIEKEIELL